MIRSPKKYTKSLTCSFKLNRILLKKRKTELRQRNETSEETTYETDVGFLQNINISISLAMLDFNEEPIIVFFDLEIVGFAKTAEVLQIAAKVDEQEFSVYIKLTKSISDEASAVHGLRVIDGSLRPHGVIVITLPILDALISFYQFLASFGRKRILAAHDCLFDNPRLINIIEKVHMINHFGMIIQGFCDTLPVIRRVTKNKGKGENKLEKLAKEYNINNDNAHDAILDVRMLDEI